MFQFKCIPILSNDYSMKKRTFYNRQSFIPLCYKQHQILNKLDLSWIIFHIRIFTSKILGYGRGVYHFNFLLDQTSMIYHLSCQHLFLRFLIPPLNNVFTLQIIFHQSNSMKMVVLHNPLARYGGGWLLSRAQKQPRHKKF